MVTMKDIANRLGVAISTVSKGLNGANDISEDMRQLILDTAIEMGYVPRSMKKEANKKICVFIENMEYESPSDFGFDIVLGFRQMAFRDRWSVSVIPLTPQLQMLEKYDSYMLKKGYSGAFLVGLEMNDEWMKQLRTTTIPTVLLDNYIKKNPNVGYVGTDSLEGIDLCVTHLASLGHKNIALLNGDANSNVSQNRNDAFFTSMRENSIPVNPELVACGSYGMECAKNFVSDFITEGATAIVCAADTIAAGVISECRKAGLNVPKDISVTGFDDLPLAEQLTPQLTTIQQDRALLGKSGYNVLSGLIEELPLSRTMLRAKLMVRSSTAPLKPTNH